MHRVKLPAGDADMVPSNHWPEPLVAEPVAHDRGPVLILIEYKVEKQHRSAFLHASMICPRSVAAMAPMAGA
jgi:hypothetical protein